MEVEELNSLPPQVKLKVVKLVQDHHKAIELQSVFEKQKIESDQDVFEIRQQLESSLKQLDEVSVKKVDAESRLREIENDRNEKVYQLHQAQALCDEAVNQKNELSRKLDLVASEKTDIKALYERKKSELDEAKKQAEKYEAQIKSLLLEKCKNQIKLDEIQSKELAVEHREKRWSSEKQMMDQEKRWYMDETRSKDQQIFTLRKEMGLKELEFQTALSAKEDLIAQLKFESEEQKRQIEQLTNQVGDLNNKLKKAAEEAESTRVTFEKEQLCQTKLGEVYKQSTEEAEQKVEELTAALEEVKQLYNEVKENHFTMQEEMKNMESEHGKALKAKEEEVLELKDELEKANELLRSKHRVMLTDEEVAALSPGAAAASKLIKAGISLTSIYRDHCKVVEELEEQKCESKRLEGYIKEIVADITTKAPILKQQRDDYYETLETVSRLKAQLKEVGKQTDETREDRDMGLRQLTYTRAELERYQRDNADLAAQVRQLLQCVEKARRGETEPTVSLFASAPCDPMPSAEDLLLFRDIDELQSTNQRLMSALRKAEAKREEMVKAAQEAEMSKVQNELENALSELRTLKDHREKQDLVLDTVCKQRDTYKKICKELKSKTPTKESLATEEEQLEGQQVKSDAQAAMDHLQKEFDLYRREKCETEKMLSEKVDRLSAENSELRSSNMKLDTDYKYQEQRFKILAGNTETYKKESAQLRERLATAGALTAKHEQKISELTQELIGNQEKLAKIRVEAQSLGERLQSSRSHEQKLQQELTTLRANSHSHEMLIASLQELQTRLDRSEAEKNLKVQISLDSMTREKNNLQQTLNTLSEQQQEYVRDSKVKVNDLQNKLDTESTKVKTLESKLDWEQKSRKDSEERAEKLQKQLEMLASGNKDATGERFQKESQQLQTRLNYLEKQHEETKRKLEETNEKLHRADTEIADYKRVSETMETSLKNQQETEIFAKKQLEEVLETTQRELETTKTEALNLSEEKSQLSLRVQTLTSEMEQTKREVAAKILGFESEIRAKTEEADNWRRKEEQSGRDRDEQARVASEWEMKFLQETAEKQSKEEELDQLKDSIRSFEDLLVEAQSTLAGVENELQEKKSAWIAKEGELQVEIDRLKRKETELEKSNSSLFEQMEKLGKQVAVLERYKEPSASAETTELSVEERNAETATSLTEVISSLRAQWQESLAKAEQATEESDRLKGREELLQRELEAARAECLKAQQETKALLASENERIALVAKLKAMEQLEARNKVIMEEKLRLEMELVQARQKSTEVNGSLNRLESEKRALTTKLESVQRNMSALEVEVQNWKERHQQLLEQKAAMDSEQAGKLRTELEESREKSRLLQSSVQQHQMDLMKNRQKMEELENELKKIRANFDESQEQNDNTTSELLDLKQKYEQLEGEFRQKTNLLQSARKLAVKYKTLWQELKGGGPGTPSAGVSSTPTVGAESAPSTPDRAPPTPQREDSAFAAEIVALREKIKALEAANKELEDKVAANAKTSKAMGSLTSRLDSLQKGSIETKSALETTAKQLISEKTENKKLTTELKTLQAEKAKLEATLEEKESRLNLITSIHSGCEKKAQKLNDQIVSLREEKAQISAPSVQAVVQPVAAMTSADRAGSSGEQQRPTGTVRPAGRSNLPLRTMASVRPLGTPSPRFPNVATQPDQSSSSGSVAAITPIVSTTQQPNTTSSSSLVPHAFVTPHVESQQQEAVSGSSDAVVSAISSSTPTSISSSSGGRMLITLDNNTQEASTSAADSSRKRAMDQAYESEAGSSKRLRPDSSEQVSTSDVTAGAEDQLAIVEEEDGAQDDYRGEIRVEEDEEDEEDIMTDEEGDSDDENRREIEPRFPGDGENVADTDGDEDDMNEGEEGDSLDQPESSLASEGDDDIQVVEEVQGGFIPQNETFQAGSSGHGHHMQVHMARSFPMGLGLDEGDEGVVPSTPTLVSQSVSSAHVPQGQFFEMNFLPNVGASSEAAAEGVPESVAHQNVPGGDTPGQGSPPQVSLDSDSGNATSTVNVVESGLGMEDDFETSAQFLPGEANDEEVQEGIETDNDYDTEDDNQQGSEAIPVTVTTDIQDVQADAEGGDEANQPSTSNQTQRVKLRKPIVWDIQGRRGASGDSNEPSSSNRGRQTARRSRLRGPRGQRGGLQKP